MFGATFVTGILVLGVLSYMLVFQEDPTETLVIYTNEATQSFDPAVATDRASAVPICNIYETLVSYRDSNSTTPAAWLATSWSVSPDSRWYNFSLRLGVTFSNGNAFTAGDVRFTIERVVAIQGLQEAQGNVVAEYVDLENISTADDYTISIKLLKPHAGFLAVLAKSMPMGIMDKEYSLAQYSPTDLYARSYLREHPMGTGPYVLDQWREDSSITMLRNQHYWRSWEGEHVKRVILKENYAVDVRKDAILDGRADVIELPLSSLSNLGAFSGLGVKQTRDFRVDLVLMNAKSESASHAFMTDSGVRRAFCYAFNYRNVSTNLYHGYIEDMQGVVPNGFPLESSAQPSKAFYYNLTVASQLLNQSGFPLDEYGRRFGGTYLDFLVNESDPHKQAIAYAFKEDLNRLGINVSFRNATDKYIQITGYWDMCIVSYVPDYIDPAAPVRALAVSGAAGGDEFKTGTENSAIDLAAVSALAATSEALRAEIYSDIYESHNSDPNVILIGQVRQVCVYSPTLNSFSVNPVNLYSFYDCSK